MTTESHLSGPRSCPNCRRPAEVEYRSVSCCRECLRLAQKLEDMAERCVAVTLGVYRSLLAMTLSTGKLTVESGKDSLDKLFEKGSK